MAKDREELATVDESGAVTPVGEVALARLKARKGSMRVLPAPSHFLVLKTDESGPRSEALALPVCRLGGEITAAGALCDVVAFLGQSAWSGELLVSGGETRSIFFDSGAVIGAQSTAERERMGAVFYRYGVLTEAEVEAALGAVTAEVRIGEAAIRLGLLTEDKLFHLVSRQTEEIMYAAMLETSGMFYFLDRYDPKRLPSRQRISIPALLMEVVRRMDEMRYFRERIPSDAYVPAPTASRQSIHPELSPVFHAIDGERSIADLSRVLGQGEFEVTHAVYQLLQSGRVVVNPPRPSTVAAVMQVINEVSLLIHAEVDAVGKGAELRELLAAFLEQSTAHDVARDWVSKAGSNADGSIRADAVLAAARTVQQSDRLLARWAHEYLSFAVFLAETWLRNPADGGQASSQALSQRVALLLAPLAVR